MLHTNDIDRYHRCHRLYKLYREDQRVNPHSGNWFSFLNFCTSPEESIRRYFGITDYFHGQIGDPNESARMAMEESDWLIGARFEYRGLRVKVPYLHKEPGGWAVYFPVYSLQPQDDLAGSQALTAAVLEKLRVTVSSIRLIYLNREYRRLGDLDDQRLWIVSDRYCGSRGRPGKAVAAAIAAAWPDLDALLDEIAELDGGSLPAPSRCPSCSRRTRCRYFSQCFPAYDSLCDNSILYLSGCGAKEDMCQAGRVRLRDADPERIVGTRTQYAQIMADRGRGNYTDRLVLAEWFRSIKSSPAAFLDFEWDIFAIPPYDGMKPFDVLPFLYSVDIAKDGEIRHREFLGQGDDREELIVRLLNDLPEEGNIYAYNAIGAEMIRIRELAEQFPAYADRLLALNERMYDLSLPFEAGLIYDLGMRGSYSLKSLNKVIDAGHLYGDLEISEGLEAVRKYREYQKMADSKAKEELGRELCRYCSMDTGELAKVYRWIAGLTGQNEKKLLND